jgi:hypothetical protein
MDQSVAIELKHSEDWPAWSYLGFAMRAARFRWNHALIISRKFLKQL